MTRRFGLSVLVLALAAWCASESQSEAGRHHRRGGCGGCGGCAAPCDSGCGSGCGGCTTGYEDPNMQPQGQGPATVPVPPGAPGGLDQNAPRPSASAPGATPSVATDAPAKSTNYTYARPARRGLFRR